MHFVESVGRGEWLFCFCSLTAQ